MTPMPSVTYLRDMRVANLESRRDFENSPAKQPTCTDRADLVFGKAYHSIPQSSIMGSVFGRVTQVTFVRVQTKIVEVVVIPRSVIVANFQSTWDRADKSRINYPVNIAGFMNTIFGQHDARIWDIAWAVVEADAKLIVRAVNSHAALVAACEGLLDENDTEPHGECDCAQCVARAALAAAKETPDAGH